MALLSVEEALARIVADVVPVSTERVGLFEADNRILVEPVVARRTQPPFDVSAMDGFAVRKQDVAELPTTLRLLGQSAAGHGYRGALGAGDAVRIFTGAPLPDGADAIVIQEDCTFDAETVTVGSGGAPEAGHLRKRGYDFTEGDRLIAPGRKLTSRDVTLAAAAGYPDLEVRRKPRVALLATGDELVLPGEPVGSDQIVCSNPFGIAAIVRRAGGEPIFLGIAKDDKAELSEKCAQARDADVLLTIGGASVGDHDFVGPVLEAMGMSLSFWRIGMRPGKPLLSGRLGDLHVLGVPGNPVSSMVGSRIFLVPLINALLGLPDESLKPVTAHAAVELSKNGPRQHYMRATQTIAADGRILVMPVASQDSSLIGNLAKADCLIVRPPHDPEVPAGATVAIMPLDF
jgi:molybdopterin molybdotransferase